ncbi:hypothetical protein ACFOWM_06300 [Ferruginibacter yonginensis]|uniref:Uncharacterized protein n=1 Tax=Ferruginibacter yonginensis TaxID=1310416 RepID=A0ABV8QS27_9BACT
MGGIQEAIKKLGDKGDEVYGKICTVVSVDADAKTCDLKPIDGSAELLDVPFNADATTAAAEIKKPKVGSKVLVVFLDKHHAQICNVSELDSYFLQIGSVVLKIDDSGFLIKKENENLKKLMNDLLVAIKAMKFTTNAGPTIQLINSATFTQLQTRFNNLLNDN